MLVRDGMSYLKTPPKKSVRRGRDVAVGVWVRYLLRCGRVHWNGICELKIKKMLNQNQFFFTNVLIFVFET